ncbi:MAG TPA: DNA repair protein RecN [Anaerolineae bacterium]|nr:DNA repair protein RecN [Anaerolineae bacterium]HIQ09653.1 DNA repair protein RecN [Anaerolineaceae bacterium]
MLSELRIEHFAIIDRLELSLEPGLVVFTGETGAGKSILVDAMALLLGHRAESIFIRQGEKRAYVEGVFLVPPEVRDLVAALLEPEELLDDPEVVVLARELRANGRHLARINGRTVSLALLRQVGQWLVDVHGQSEHLSLFRVREHLPLLDRYAGVAPLREAYQEAYRRWKAVVEELEHLRRLDREAIQRADLLRYQIEEIAAANLQEGEEEALREERLRLANAEKLAEAARQALLVLEEGTSEAPSASDLLGQAVDAVETLSRIDPTQTAQAEVLTHALETLNEVALRLRDYLEGIEFNPRRLNAVEERLALLENLKRKYGATVGEILAYAEQARQELESITHAEERIAELEEERQRLEQVLAQQGLALSEARRQAAARLSRAVEAELADLRMSGARFEVGFTRRPDPQGLLLPDGQRVAFDAQGIDRVEFLLAPNPGEGLKPLAKIASGGESSRLMLALKRVLAQADRTPILIFDEIDQGIGGRLGAVVGEKLWRLARHHQVLCITHLPQLAAFGDQHFRVRKEVMQGRTVTKVEPLEGEARVHELAQMLGAGHEALASAQALLQQARRVASSQLL